MSINSTFSLLKRLIFYFLKKNQEVKNRLIKFYLSSIFYSKKHIRRKNYDWISSFSLKIVDKESGILIYKKFKFYLSKNEYHSIPDHQKYLYCNLISKYKIPSYYLLFWDDLIVFHEIFIKNIYKDDIFKLKADTILLDIGASIGWYTIKMSDILGKNSLIISIEPDPDNFSYLKRNIIVNNLENIIVINKGVWSKNLKKQKIGVKYASSIDFIDSNKQNSLVSLEKIDKILFDLKITSVDIIKMDIEGAEIEAVKGAIKTFKTSENLIIKIAAYHEVFPKVQSYHILIPLLEDLGFRIKKEYLPMIIGKKF